MGFEGGDGSRVFDAVQSPELGNVRPAISAMWIISVIGVSIISNECIFSVIVGSIVLVRLHIVQHIPRIVESRQPRRAPRLLLAPSRGRGRRRSPQPAPPRTRRGPRRPFRESSDAAGPRGTVRHRPAQASRRVGHGEHRDDPRSRRREEGETDPAPDGAAPSRSPPLGGDLRVRLGVIRPDYPVLVPVPLRSRRSVGGLVLGRHGVVPRPRDLRGPDDGEEENRARRRGGSGRREEEEGTGRRGERDDDDCERQSADAARPPMLPSTEQHHDCFSKEGEEWGGERVDGPRPPAQHNFTFPPQLSAAETQNVPAPMYVCKRQEVILL